MFIYSRMFIYDSHHYKVGRGGAVKWLLSSLFVYIPVQNYSDNKVGVCYKDWTLLFLYTLKLEGFGIIRLKIRIFLIIWQKSGNMTQLNGAGKITNIKPDYKKIKDHNACSETNPKTTWVDTLDALLNDHPARPRGTWILRRTLHLIFM